MTSILAICPILAVVAGLTLGPAPLPPFGLDCPEPRPTLSVGDPAHQGADGESPAVALLETLEASDRDLHAFTATVHYEIFDALLEAKVIHKGSLVYRVDPSTRAKSFAILFDKMIELAEGGNVLNEEDKHYVCSGGWLAEIDHKNRQFIKRQIAAPGDDFDPLKLGEGPIPLPIDQPKDEVLRRFDASLVELPQEGPLAKLRGVFEVDGLRLVPKPDRPETKDFAEVLIFYDRLTRLPVGIDVLEPGAGNRKTVRLGDIRRNPPLDAETLAKLSIETPEGDWRIDIRPMSR